MEKIQKYLILETGKRVRMEKNDVDLLIEETELLNKRKIISICSNSA